MTRTIEEKQTFFGHVSLGIRVYRAGKEESRSEGKIVELQFCAKMGTTAVKL